MKANFHFYNFLLPLLLCLFLSLPIAAQEGTIHVYGYSGLTFDQVNNTARGTSYTEMDYETYSYYTPYVCGSIYADNLELVRSCGGGIQRATRINTTNVGNANTVMVVSDHYVDLRYQEDPYTSYADYYGYGLLLNTANPIFTYFFPPLIYNSLNEDSKNLGSTDVSIQRNTCGDVRDQIVLEYRNATYGPPAAIPSCNYFVNSIPNGEDFPHFTFNELNTGDHAWALLGQQGRSLPLGLEIVRTNNGNVALHVKSGYRCPQHNYNIIPQGATDSQHIYGFAGDIYTVNNWDQDAWWNLRQAALNAYACCEPLDRSGYGHVHADWRSQNPLFNPVCPATWSQ